MVDVSDDTKIAYIFHGCKYTTLSEYLCSGLNELLKNIHFRKVPGIRERSSENGYGTLENHFLVTAKGHHIYFANVIIYSIAARLMCVFIPAIPVDIRIGGSKNLLAPAVEDFHVHMING